MLVLEVSSLTLHCLLFGNYIISATFTEGEVLLLRWVCADLQTLRVLLGEVGRTLLWLVWWSWPRETWPQYFWWLLHA